MPVNIAKHETESGYVLVGAIGEFALAACLGRHIQRSLLAGEASFDQAVQEWAANKSLAADCVEVLATGETFWLLTDRSGQRCFCVRFVATNGAASALPSKALAPC